MSYGPNQEFVKARDILFQCPVCGRCMRDCLGHNPNQKEPTK